MVAAELQRTETPTGGAFYGSCVIR
jgi:hypothetical protein